MMNWKGCGRNLSRLNLRYYPGVTKEIYIMSEKGYLLLKLKVKNHEFPNWMQEC
jgi:hypothetical protein